MSEKIGVNHVNSQKGGRFHAIFGGLLNNYDNCDNNNNNNNNDNNNKVIFQQLFNALLLSSFQDTLPMC